MLYVLINTVTHKPMPRIERVRGTAVKVDNTVKVFKTLRHALIAAEMVSLVTKQEHIVHKHGDKYVPSKPTDPQPAILR